MSNSLKVLDADNEEQISIYLDDALILNDVCSSDKRSFKSPVVSLAPKPDILTDYNVNGHIDNLTEKETLLLFELWGRVLELSKALEKSTSSKLTEAIFRDFIKIPERLSTRKKRRSSSTFSLPSFDEFSHEADKMGLRIVESDPYISPREMPNSMHNEESMAAFNELWLGLLGNFSLPDVTLLRFLRARKWNVNDSFAFFLECLNWRWKHNVLSLIMREGESGLPTHLLTSGKTIFYGTDKSGHLLIYIISKKHDKRAQTYEENERYTIYHMELAIRLLGNAMEKATVIFDLNDAGYNSLDLSSIKQLIGCIQNNYPESLHRCFVLNAPWIFWAFWKLISPLLDPVVASKVTFLKKSDELLKYIDESNIPAFVLAKKKSNRDASIPLCDNRTINHSSYWDDVLIASRKTLQDKTAEIIQFIMGGGNPNASDCIQKRRIIQEEYKIFASKALLKTYSKNIYEQLGILDHDDPTVLDWTKKPV